MATTKKVLIDAIWHIDQAIGSLEIVKSQLPELEYDLSSYYEKRKHKVYPAINGSIIKLEDIAGLLEKMIGRYK